MFLPNGAEQTIRPFLQNQDLTTASDTEEEFREYKSEKTFPTVFEYAEEDKWDELRSAEETDNVQMVVVAASDVPEQRNCDEFKSANIEQFRTEACEFPEQEPEKCDELKCDDNSNQEEANSFLGNFHVCEISSICGEESLVEAVETRPILGRKDDEPEKDENPQQHVPPPGSSSKEDQQHRLGRHLDRIARRLVAHQRASYRCILILAVTVSLIVLYFVLKHFVRVKRHFDVY